MKAIVVILGVACAALSFGLYKSSTGASSAAAEALKLTQTFSNQVAELRTRLALEQGTAMQSHSNLQSVLGRRIGQLVATSNRLVQVGLLLTAAQTEKTTAQSELQRKAAQLAVVERERDELKQQVDGIPALEKQLADVKLEATRATGDLELLVRDNQQLQVEKDVIIGKLDDIGFLRIQLEKAEENAELRRRLAKAGQNAPVDKKAPLELQPDGTVRAVAPTVVQAKQ